MKLFKLGIPPSLSFVFVILSMYSLNSGDVFPLVMALDKSFLATKGSAFDTTALFARMMDPSASLTPQALPFSTKISSTCELTHTRPPFFFSTPLDSASAIAPLPPLGKSRVTPGLYQSASMYAITAFIVPEAGRPCKRKQSISSQFLTNSFLRSISSIISPNGSFKACPCFKVSKSSLGYLSNVTTAPASSRNAIDVNACAASLRGPIRFISPSNSSRAPGPPCSSNTSPNSSGPILAANFFPLGNTVPQRS
mmetsp:Transcript_6547/g.9570  ORF Transcript_6547/g.9570 Transcript_6547/m.9570 type:complete len:253 (+) Transcript_6547:767-1525(+)